GELAIPASPGGLEFLPRCGSVLPLSRVQNVVTCTYCGITVNMRNFKGKVVKTSGPVIDRHCSPCGHEEMAYHPRQIRSAHEGHIVFYTCSKHKFPEKEDLILFSE
uniref:TFIIS-type domain-containing protein n=1 Tax=Castor canadensis TaxID=51338 RepID=A0A8C0ZTE6_CASCN